MAPSTEIRAGIKGLIALLGVLLLSDCTAGVVVRDEPRQPGLDGVTVRARPCPDCPEAVAQTGRDGRFDFGFWRDVTPAAGGEATEYTFERDGYWTVTVYHNPLRGRELEVTMTARNDFRDRDGDGLSDTHEITVGSDPGSVDGDADGIPDAWEVLGHAWVDYASWGADPGARDIFVEVDYERVRLPDGSTQHARLSGAVVQKMVELFASLDAGDGEGFALHLLQTPIDRSRCAVPPEAFNPLHRRTFHYARTRVGTAFDGAGEAGSFRASSPQINDDPSDDQFEKKQYFWYAGFVHELGHSLGLGHGGSDDFGCKPNYPSVMNYSYGGGFDPRRNSLRNTDVQFSTRVVPALDERNIRELNPFGALTAADVWFLRYHSEMRGGPIPHEQTADGLWVDWDRDGVRARDMLIRSNVGDCTGGDQVTRLLVDTAADAFIAANLATILPDNR